MNRKFRYFWLQLKLRNGEHEQVFIRVVLGALIWLYAKHYGITGYPMQLISAVQVYAWGLFGYTLLAENSSRARQWFAMVMDIGFVTVVMMTTAEVGAVYYWVYLWVILGNGIRYGKWPLIGGYLLSLIGISAVFISNGFWHEHKQIMLGLFLTLFLVPIYVLKLVIQLNEAIDKANISDKAKSYLLAIMNHELRTPLNGIVGASRLLEETKLTKDQQSLVNILNKSSKILHSIIDHLLTFTKTESALAESKDKSATFSMNVVVQNTLEIFRIQAREKGVSLSVFYESDVHANLIGDSTYLQQILINLIGNAVKFTSAGGNVRLHIGTVFENNMTARIRFSISDTGIGILPGERTNLFHKFAQANEGIARKYGGTGLGITIAKDLVKIMNGDIGVYSIPNKGSTFWFEVPFIKKVGSTEVIKQTSGEKKMLVIALGISENEQEKISNLISGWGMTFEYEESLPLFFSTFQSAEGEQVAVLCKPGNVGMDPEHFAKHVMSVAGNKEVALVLVDIEKRYTESQAQGMGYTAVLHEPTDKTMLFNALKFKAVGTGEGPVTFIRDQYIRKRIPYNILVADDNRVNRMITSKILERAGYQVVLAEDGDQALDILESHSIDLMVLDMKMPTTDGLDVMRIHRATSLNNGRTPVIILTANATLDARNECLQAGVDAFMTKPVNADQLLETIARILESSKPKGPPSGEGANNQFRPEGMIINEKTLDSLKKLGDGQLDFTEEVVLGFIEEMKTVLDRMDRALDKKEMESFRTLAYSIQGGSSNVGADSLFIISNDVTHMDRAKLESLALNMLDSLKECFKMTQVEMLKYIRKNRELLQTNPLR